MYSGKKAVSCQSVTCVCVMANGRTNGLSRGFIRALCFHWLEQFNSHTL